MTFSSIRSWLLPVFGAALMGFGCLVAYDLHRAIRAGEAVVWNVNATVADADVTLRAIAPELAATATANRITGENVAATTGQVRRVVTHYADDLTAPKSTGQKIAGVLGTVAGVVRKFVMPF